MEAEAEDKAGLKQVDCGICSIGRDKAYWLTESEE